MTNGSSAETGAESSAVVRVSNLPLEDLALGLLVTFIDKAGAGSSAGITVFTGAGVLSGQLISRAEWRDSWVDQIEGANEEIGQMFRKLFIEEVDAHRDEVAEEDIPPTNFLHLRDATLFNGPHQHAVPLWRGRLSQLDGWMMGAYSTD